MLAGLLEWNDERYSLSGCTVLLWLRILDFIAVEFCEPQSACKASLTYRFLSWLMHFVTTARIHSSSLPPVAPSPLLVFVGGWKATFRPSCRGSCGANASRRAFGSREKVLVVCGPTDARGGTVIDMDRDGVPAAGVAAGATEGEWALGRLLRFSVDKR